MKAKIFFLAVACTVALPAAAQSRIEGHYAEFRTADVYTGPCFANSETGLTGSEAVLAWQVTRGSWNNVPLDGLSVVAVVRASATLGDAFANPLPAKAVLIVDARATQPQRAALVAFAQAQTAGLLGEIVAIEASPIRFEANVGGRHGFTTVEAAHLAKLSTRPVGQSDRICHNESVYYEPLAANLDHAMPAVAVVSSYGGNHLDVTWTESGRRGSFTGTFAQ
jgi:hypothetical protein